jgi:hypothetical protein
LELIRDILISLIAFLFISSFIDKLLHWKNHYKTAEGYKIISGIFLKVILAFFLLIEIYIGMSMFIFKMSLLNVVMAIVLITIYTLAVIFNLLRGNTEISCGCGGLLESPKLHWGIVIRNIFLIGIIALLYKSNTNYNFLFNISKLFSLFIALYLLLFYGSLKHISVIIKNKSKIH